jgi:hypothetical protein
VVTKKPVVKVKKPVPKIREAKEQENASMFWQEQYSGMWTELKDLHELLDALPRSVPRNKPSDTLRNCSATERLTIWLLNRFVV